MLWLTLQDDGAGYDTAQSNQGMGLANIKLRAAEIGGTVQIESAPGQGASLTVQIPLGLPELDKFERQSNVNLVVGLVSIFILGLFNLAPPYYQGMLVFLLPVASLILPLIGEETVKTHISNILGKLRLMSRTQAVIYAVLRQLTIRPVFSTTSSGRLPFVPMMQSSDFCDLRRRPH